MKPENTTDSYHCEVPIAAPASTIYAALTTQQGIENWWTDNCDVAAIVGDQITVRFGQTFKTFRIESLRPDNEVRWRCVDSHIHALGLLTKVNEWIGTTISFRLVEPSPRNTLLQFEHLGLVPEVECYDLCTSGWAQFLGSLKAYAETGKGTPYLDQLVPPSQPEHLNNNPPNA